MSEVAKLHPSLGQAMESVLIDGDLQKLSSEQRVIYYKKICESLGLNYLTKPFAYIRLNGKLTLYALKDCSEQLRKRDGVSIYAIKNELIEGVYVVTAYARTKDVATGAVPLAGLKGEALANAYMKAETKAKRRVTLSLCGLGMNDQEEIESIPLAQKVDVCIETGEIRDPVVADIPVIVPAIDRKYKSDEKILESISQEQLNILAEEISTASDIDTLKSSYARAYVLHGLREDLMPRLKELKDIRKLQLESADIPMKKTFGDEECPDLTGDIL